MKKDTDKKRNRGHRDSEAVIQLRVNQILNIILHGYTRMPEIMQYISLMDKKAKNRKRGEFVDWVPISTKNVRTIFNYIRKAKEIIIEEGKLTLDNMKNTYRAMLMELYRKAFEAEEYRVANSVMRNLIYLDSLGSFNLKETLNILNFDVKVTEKEEREYHKRLWDYCKPPLRIDDGDMMQQN